MRSPQRPTPLQRVLHAIRREGGKHVRTTALILAGLGFLGLGFTIGILMGHASDPAWWEAAGTWVGALVSIGTVIVAVRVFLSDKNYQDYQVRTDQEREADAARRELEGAQREADKIDFGVGYSGTPGDYARYEVAIHNMSHDRITQVTVQHVDIPDLIKEAVWLAPNGDLRVEYLGGLLREEPSPQRFIDGVIVTFAQEGWLWRKRGKQRAQNLGRQ